MARQEAQSKLLCYPPSEQVIDLAATWLTNPTHSRLADPCVGEEQALARLKSTLGDVVNLFTDPNQRVPVAVTTSPTGSPTAVSPKRTIFDLLLAQARGEIQVARKVPRKVQIAAANEPSISSITTDHCAHVNG